MCFGGPRITPPPPPPPAPPPPFKRAMQVESASPVARKGIKKRVKGTSQLTYARPTMGGIQQRQSGVRT
jgi:hypothetical protein